jgi:very-short-patch-repair endonuclease
MFLKSIKIDGEIHLKKEIQEYDDGRTHDIEKFGIKICDFPITKFSLTLVLLRR